MRIQVDGYPYGGQWPFTPGSGWPSNYIVNLWMGPTHNGNSTYEIQDAQLWLQNYAIAPGDIALDWVIDRHDEEMFYNIGESNGTYDALSRWDMGNCELACSGPSDFTYWLLNDVGISRDPDGCCMYDYIQFLRMALTKVYGSPYYGGSPGDEIDVRWEVHTYCNVIPPYWLRNLTGMGHCVDGPKLWIIATDSDSDLSVDIYENDSTGPSAREYAVDYTAAHVVYYREGNWPALTPTSSGGFDYEETPWYDSGNFSDLAEAQMDFATVCILLKLGPGDVDLDKDYDSSDIVQMNVSGKYEDSTDYNALWTEGDCNLDGDFTSNDITMMSANPPYYEEGEYFRPDITAIPTTQSRLYCQSIQNMISPLTSALFGQVVWTKEDMIQASADRAAADWAMARKLKAESEDGKWIRDFYLYKGRSEAVASLAQEAFDDTGDVKLATAIADGELDYEPVESK